MTGRLLPILRGCGEIFFVPSAVLGALLLVAALADPPMAAAGALCLLAAYGLAVLLRFREPQPAATSSAAAGITTVLDSVVIGDLDEGGPRCQTQHTSIAALHQCRDEGLMRIEHLLHLRCELPARDMPGLLDSVAEHPLVGFADTCGLVAGLNLVRTKAATVHDCVLFEPGQGVGMICRGHMFDNGMIMRAVGERMIIAPPLIMTRAQIDEMVALISLCLDATHTDLQRRGWV